MAAWFQRYDEAEKIFIDADRRDLAISLRKRLGDWFKVLQLLKSGGGGMSSDAEMEESWNQLGEYFAERHRFEDAVQYFEKVSESASSSGQLFHFCTTHGTKKLPHI